MPTLFFFSIAVSSLYEIYMCVCVSILSVFIVILLLIDMNIDVDTLGTTTGGEGGRVRS